MDRETELVDRGENISPEAFQDLEKRLDKAESKLAKAKTRAQATMQEIWQLDHRLKEEEERANKAEARLAEVLATASFPMASEDSGAGVGLEGSVGDAEDKRVERLQESLGQLQFQLDEERAGKDSIIRELRQQLDGLRVQEGQPRDSEQAEFDEEWYRVRLDALRVSLDEAQERTREAEERLSGVLTSADVFGEQLLGVQSKLREAEERALEWEERFHRSEDRAIEWEERFHRSQENNLEVGELSAARDDLQSQVSELKIELAHWKEVSAAATLALEQAKVEYSNSNVDSELVTGYEERLKLAEERSTLLQQKAEEAAAKLSDLEDAIKRSESDRQELAVRLAQTEALLRDSQERLSESLESLKRSASQQPQSAASAGSISLDLSEEAAHKKLQEAYKKTREAELKASQIEIQLQKVMASLKEYEQRANESDRETQRLAFQDLLTGLPNLNLIRQYLDFTVKQVQRYQRASALLVLDIDRFKLINDAMGMKAGDELLVRMAERLQTAIRESDALGRRGEDEFLILLSELFTGDDSVSAEQKTHMIRQSIAIVVNRISESLSRPFLIQGQKFYVRVSIGVSICPNDADTPQAMLEHADSAMYHAKENGRGRCVFYNVELHKKQERRLAMDSQLRLAMERGEFSLLYQPIIEVNKGKGQVVGVEALVRWNHRMEGLLLPHQFLPVAEETGVIVPLGQWVFRQACWQLRQWLSSGTNLFMAINVSRRQMMQADLSEVVLSSIDEFGLQPGLIFVEIAEGGSVEEVDLVERNVVNLGKAGIRISIDDFGSGYNSLSRLDMQHIQFLKIAPDLVAGVQQDKVKANLCEGVIRLAQSLEIKALAEGVETMAQAKFLSKIGCQFMQGFYLHEPASASDITQLLAERRVWKF